MTDGAKLTMVHSHCHIDMPPFDADREAVRVRAFRPAIGLLSAGDRETRRARP